MQSKNHETWEALDIDTAYISIVLIIYITLKKERNKKEIKKLSILLKFHNIITLHNIIVALLDPRRNLTSKCNKLIKNPYADSSFLPRFYHNRFPLCSHFTTRERRVSRTSHSRHRAPRDFISRWVPALRENGATMAMQPSTIVFRCMYERYVSPECARDACRPALATLFTGRMTRRRGDE